jgi:hypothetical protein
LDEGLGLPRLPFFSPLAENFANKPDGYLAGADTGQDWLSTSNPDATAQLLVHGGRLTNLASNVGVAAGYYTAGLGGLITSMSAQFSFLAGLGGVAGAIVMIAFRSPLNNVNVLPDAGLHLSILRQGWGVDYISGDTIVPITSAGFSSQLYNDGTIYTASVAIAGNTATLTLPDGQHVVTDSHIGSLAGSFACFEVFQNVAGGVSADDKPGFISVAASH